MVSDATRSIRLAVVSDTHCVRDAQEDQAVYRSRLARVIAEVNAATVDRVLMPGDLTEHGEAGEIADFKSQIAAFSAPVLLVPGNHDVGGKAGGSNHRVTEDRVTAYESEFGPAFYEQANDGLRIVGVNASLLGSGLKREQQQWDLLEAAFAGPSAALTVLLAHYPPFLKSPDEPADPYWNMDPAPRTRLLALARRGGVRAVVSGHLHRPLEHRLDGLVLVTAPPVSFGLPRHEQPEGWMLVECSAAGEVRATPRYVEGTASSTPAQAGAAAISRSPR